MHACHVVDELRFELALGSEELAFELHERLGAFASRAALDIIGERLDARDPGDGVLRLERLEIAVGPLPVDETDALWGDRLRMALDRALDAAFAVDTLGTAAAGGTRQDAAAASAAKVVAHGPVAHVEAARAEFEIVWHLLHHGCLPWQAAHLRPTAWESLCRRVVEHRGKELLRAIETSDQRARLQERIRSQWPADVVERLDRLREVHQVHQVHDLHHRPHQLAQKQLEQPEHVDAFERPASGRAGAAVAGTIGPVASAAAEMLARAGRPPRATTAQTPSTAASPAATAPPRGGGSRARALHKTSPATKFQWLRLLAGAPQAERWAQLPGLVALQWLTGEAPGAQAQQRVETVMWRELLAARERGSTPLDLLLDFQQDATQLPWLSTLQRLVARLIDSDTRHSITEQASRVRDLLAQPLLRAATPVSVWQAITSVFASLFERGPADGGLLPDALSPPLVGPAAGIPRMAQPDATTRASADLAQHRAKPASDEPLARSATNHVAEPVPHSTAAAEPTAPPPQRPPLHERRLSAARRGWLPRIEALQAAGRTRQLEAVVAEPQWRCNTPQAVLQTMLQPARLRAQLAARLRDVEAVRAGRAQPRTEQRSVPTGRVAPRDATESSARRPAALPTPEISTSQPPSQRASSVVRGSKPTPPRPYARQRGEQASLAAGTPVVTGGARNVRPPAPDDSAATALAPNPAAIAGGTGASVPGGIDAPLATNRTRPAEHAMAGHGDLPGHAPLGDAPAALRAHARPLPLPASATPDARAAADPLGALAPARPLHERLRVPPWRAPLHAALERAALSHTVSAWLHALTQDREWLRAQLAEHGRNTRWRWRLARDLHTTQLLQIASLWAGTDNAQATAEFARLPSRPRPWLTSPADRLEHLRHQLRAAVLDQLLLAPAGAFDPHEAVLALLTRFADRQGGPSHEAAREVLARSNELPVGQALLPTVRDALASFDLVAPRLPADDMPDAEGSLLFKAQPEPAPGALGALGALAANPSTGNRPSDAPHRPRAARSANDGSGAQQEPPTPPEAAGRTPPRPHDAPARGSPLLDSQLARVHSSAWRPAPLPEHVEARALRRFLTAPEQERRDWVRQQRPQAADALLRLLDLVWQVESGSTTPPATRLCDWRFVWREWVEEDRPFDLGGFLDRWIESDLQSAQNSSPVAHGASAHRAPGRGAARAPAATRQPPASPPRDWQHTLGSLCQSEVSPDPIERAVLQQLAQRAQALAAATAPAQASQEPPLRPSSAGGAASFVHAEAGASRQAAPDAARKVPEAPTSSSVRAAGSASSGASTTREAAQGNTAGHTTSNPSATASGSARPSEAPASPHARAKPARPPFASPTLAHPAGIADLAPQTLGPAASGARAPTDWQQPQAPALEGSLIVPDAGVVLAAFFLPRLFDRTGLLANSVFRDDAAACRAVHLLHYLSHAERIAPEPLLALDKLLCGLDLSQPVPRELDLSDAECDAVDGLLRALVQHWGVLGSTSIQGLREGFLQREGVLTHGDEGWTLTVQTRALDVLLDRLPWGIGTIKAPWMSEVLHVRWR